MPLTAKVWLVNVMSFMCSVMVVSMTVCIFVFGFFFFFAMVGHYYTVCLRDPTNGTLKYTYSHQFKKLNNNKKQFQNL